MHGDIHRKYPVFRAHAYGIYLSLSSGYPKISTEIGISPLGNTRGIAGNVKISQGISRGISRLRDIPTKDIPSDGMRYQRVYLWISDDIIEISAGDIYRISAVQLVCSPEISFMFYKIIPCLSHAHINPL